MRSTYLPICLAVLSLCSVARAQVPPPQVNPGLIQQDIDRQRRGASEQQQQVPKQQGPAVVGPQRAPVITIPGGGDRFLLRKVTFDESKFITKEELDAIASKYVGKRVDIAGLQSLVAEINQIYAQRGIVTAIATLPPQTANGGVVKVKLTEGRLQKTSVVGNQQTRESYLRNAVEQPKGEVLDVPKLNRDVVWFNRTNDVQMRALLQPGTNFGLTDLQLAITEPPVNTLQLFYDNQGVQSTGANEGGIYYKRHGLAGIDDRFTFYGVRSEGNLNGNVAYNIPVTPWGGRLGISYTQGKIKIVDGPTVGLDVTGKSSQTSVNFGQPLFINDMWLVQANAAYLYGTSGKRFLRRRCQQRSLFEECRRVFRRRCRAPEYSVTISPSFNSINWHDQTGIVGERSFNTFSGASNGSPAASREFQRDLSCKLIIHLGEAPAWRPVVLHRWTHHSAWLSDQRRGRRQRLLFQHRIPSRYVGYRERSRPVCLHRQRTGVLDIPTEDATRSSGVGASWTPTPSLTFEGSVGFPWRVVVTDQPRQQFYGRVTFRPLLLL